MRVPPLGAWTAICVATLMATSARADAAAGRDDDTGASREPREGIDVQVFGFAAGGTLVTSPADGAGAVAVCAARAAPFADDDACEAELSRRGALTSTETSDGIELACALVPPSEIELSLWAAAKRLHGPAGAVAEASRDPVTGSLARAALLSTEGAELEGAAGMPAFTVVVAGNGADRARALAERYFGVAQPLPARTLPRLRLAQASERFSEL